MGISKFKVRKVHYLKRVGLTLRVSCERCIADETKPQHEHHAEDYTDVSDKIPPLLCRILEGGVNEECVMVAHIGWNVVQTWYIFIKWLWLLLLHDCLKNKTFAVRQVMVIMAHTAILMITSFFIQFSTPLSFRSFCHFIDNVTMWLYMCNCSFLGWYCTPEAAQMLITQDCIYFNISHT